jgi:hypothetical protein
MNSLPFRRPHLTKQYPFEPLVVQQSFLAQNLTSCREVFFSSSTFFKADVLEKVFKNEKKTTIKRRKITLPVNFVRLLMFVCM